MSQTPIADLVGLCVLVAAMLFSNEAAAVVGPYLVIIIAATVGASFSLARREKTSRASAFWYFTRVNGLAVVIAGGIAVLASTYAGMTDRVLLAPVALLIGYGGDDIPGMLLRGVKWAVFRGKA